jgi:hypothetical protein
MKKLLSLAAVAGIAVATFAPAAHAEEFVARYTYLVNGAVAPAATVLPSATLTQPAIIDSGCGTQVLSAPAVIDNGCSTLPAVVGGTAPIMVQDHENIVPHLFHLGLWPLVDFSIF